MFKKLTAFGAALATVLAIGCTVTVVAPPSTTVKAQNDLTNLSVDVRGMVTKVDAIDLANVQIGDVFFSYALAGSTTSSKITNRSGKVTITVDTAIVMTKVLGINTEIPITNIDPMSMTITSNIDNKVVFDETSASALFTSLAKKKP